MNRSRLVNLLGIAIGVAGLTFVAVRIVRDREAVLSPSWSVHCGAGTGSYRFVWAMAGENQVFDDMDRLSLDQLK